MNGLTLYGREGSGVGEGKNNKHYDYPIFSHLKQASWSPNKMNRSNKKMQDLLWPSHAQAKDKQEHKQEHFQAIHATK